MKIRSVMILALLILPLGAPTQALPLRIRPRVKVSSMTRSTASSWRSSAQNLVGNRRRSRIEQREATLGSNPPPKNRDTGLDNIDHIRNQDQLTARAESIAGKNGDEIVGPAVGYYRTSHGRLVRVTPNPGTGNLRHAARLRSGENLARLEQVAFVTRRRNGLLWVAADGKGSRLGMLRGRNWIRATGGIVGTAALIFGRDVARWIGIRNSADAIQEKVSPEEPDNGPEIVIDENGQIHIDGDGDGHQELEIQGQEDGVTVNGGNGPSVVVEQGSVRTGEDEDGQQQVIIDPDGASPSAPYGLP
jgi:hypothetical protein